MAEPTPRFSPEPEPLPIHRRRTDALEQRTEVIDTDPEKAKTLLAAVHGLTLAGESVRAIAELLKLTPGQVTFAQRVLRARGELADHAAHAIEQFKHEGIIAAIEGATEKIRNGDGRFIERMLEEGGVWSKKGADGDSQGRGAINPGLPALQINVVMPAHLKDAAPAEKAVFGQVLSSPKELPAADHGETPAIQHRK